MKTRVFLIHGFQGEPNGGWRPWLMGKLAREDIFACALAMPTPDEPKKDEWVAEIAHAVGAPDEQTFLVGHSLGVLAVLQYLDTLATDEKMGGAVLVSGPFEKVRSDDPHSSLRKTDDFFTDLDFDKIKSAAKNFVVIHGDSDPLVPFSHAEKLSRALSCKLVPVLGGAHLNGSSGCYELPEALDALHFFIS